MKLLIRVLLTAVLVYFIANFLPGVTVDSFTTSIIVAVVLGLLNLFIKPLLVLFTLPVTIVTFGLFLLVINAIVIMLCDKIVGGFGVSSFWTALWFSILLSVFQSIIFSLMKENQ
ncbi:phage holin family protein [Flavobacterium sp. '19STA2R22 D10 B1']|uniref:phage holin family protein n=1 Tax=Flavobacterium aerium TaxID=3037261 RepID=UPI00278C27D8|nr:phage holin family protein [Flavobacterium sp. '19STA2R22 D10 B1']